MTRPHLETLTPIEIKNDASEVEHFLEWELKPSMTKDPVTLLQSYIQFWLEYCGEEDGATIPVILTNDLELVQPIMDLSEVRNAIVDQELDRGIRERMAWKSIGSPSSLMHHRR